MKAAVDERLQSLRDGVVRLGPQTLHIDVTNTCNTNCVTCWDHSPHLSEARPAAWKRQRVDVHARLQLIDDVMSLGGLRAVIVSGMGEPFTHPDIYVLLAGLKARGLHVTVITNLVAADVDRVIALGVDALLVGVQGASLESYLAFHPNFEASTWHRLLEGLERLRSPSSTAGPAPHKVEQKHVQVICSVNAHELPDMVRQAARYGAAQLNFKLASLKNGTEAARASAAQLQQLHDVDIAAARTLGRALGVKHNLDVFSAQVQAARAGADPDDVGEATAAIDEVGCFLGFHYSRVTVDGTVLYCCNTEVVVGHLDDAPFSTMWSGPRWQAARAQLRRGEYFSGCHQCGKLNQNVKLSARYRDAFGDAAWREAKGGDGRAQRRPGALRVLP